MTINQQPDIRASYYAYLFEQLMPVADVAMELGIPYSVARMMVENGELYGRQIAGDTWLIPRAEVMRRLAREHSLGLDGRAQSVGPSTKLADSPMVSTSAHI